MRVYFSGIGGVGIGPLAMIAHSAGYQVFGSDRQEGLMTAELTKMGIDFVLDQSGAALRQEHNRQPFDYFVYTSALPADHPELVTARELGTPTSKRDTFLAKLIQNNNLKLIAIAGTHGKTTTSGMLVWALQQLGIPVSYSVGSTLSFGPSGNFDPSSEFFVYECDEFDRNFLQFNPWVSIITSINYDHPDTYPTENDYLTAFGDFIQQSNQCIMYQQDFDKLPDSDDTTIHLIDKVNESKQINSINLPGQHNRENAYLLLKKLLSDGIDENVARSALESFPGTGRRFEKLAENLYSDYGHHPAEIAATLQMAREVSDHVVLVYQPHQNVRQYEVRDQYTDCMELAEKIYWLPTYLTRENPDLPVLIPEELTANLINRSVVHSAELDADLWQNMQTDRQQGKLVLCMGAGSIDGWVRGQIIT